MEIKVGSAVRSCAGRDKGRFMAVMALEEGYAMVADGRLRKIERPKRKKLRHLKLTGTVFDPDQMATNKRLASALHTRFDNMSGEEG